MATKRTNGKANRQPETKPASRSAEPVSARALQFLILVAGVILLFTVLFGGRWGPAVVGVIVLGSAFPPARRHVDKWLVGKARGEEANQAAVIRMVVGVLIVILSLTGVFAP